MVARQQLKEALAFFQAGELDSARHVLEQVIARVSENADAWNLLGTVCLQAGDADAAATALGKAVRLVPDHPGLLNNLGLALVRADRPADAVQPLTESVRLRPEFAGGHQNLATALAAVHHYEDALGHAREAVRLAPDNAAAWHDLGLVLFGRQSLQEAADAFRHALAIQPTHAEAASKLLYLLNLLPGLDAHAIAQEHQRVMASVYPGAGTGFVPQPASSERRVRIAYVSADFRRHAVSHFLEPLLEHHDRERYEIFAYANVLHEDSRTHWYRDRVDHWRDIEGMDDDDAVNKIRNDGIDVLIDLSGHTEGNRLGVFARRVAPIQASWLGYPATSGLEAMDVRLVDHMTTPLPGQCPGTETCVPLDPVFAAFRPSERAGDVQPPPFLKTGHVTLGSLHKLEKLNSEVLELWASILRDQPSAKLLVVRDQLNAWHRERLESTLLEAGARPEQLELRQWDPGAHSFQELFAEMDILLDVFPWCGHTLACHALWQGVPVVTLRGDRHASNMTASVLNALGAAELIATSSREYRDITGALVGEPQRLEDYRKNLRPQFEASSLRDEPGFARAFEAILTAIKTA